MVKIKICGVTNKEDALKAAYYGAWAVGFVFYQKSPRYVSPSRARKIIDELPPFVTPVGVFVDHNQRAVQDVCRFTGITTVQFHGEETPQYCSRFKNFKVIKAFRVQEGFHLSSINAYRVNAYLFDTYSAEEQGGTGKTFNWDILRSLRVDKPWILSGGLKAENIQQALQAVAPYAIDVSSGVEGSPGIKDHRLLKTFFDMASFSPADLR